MCSPDETLALPSRYICIPPSLWRYKRVVIGSHIVPFPPSSKALFFPACLRALCIVGLCVPVHHKAIKSIRP